MASGWFAGCSGAWSYVSPGGAKTGYSSDVTAPVVAAPAGARVRRNAADRCAEALRELHGARKRIDRRERAAHGRVTAVLCQSAHGENRKEADRKQGLHRLLLTVYYDAPRLRVVTRGAGDSAYAPPGLNSRAPPCYS